MIRSVFDVRRLGAVAARIKFGRFVFRRNSKSLSKSRTVHSWRSAPGPGVTESVRLMVKAGEQGAWVTIPTRRYSYYRCRKVYVLLLNETPVESLPGGGTIYKIISKQGTGMDLTFSKAEAAGIGCTTIRHRMKQCFVSMTKVQCP